MLCEKPLTLTRSAGEQLFESAGDLFCMEAMWMACHPLVRDLRTRLAAGEFGTPRQVHADLGFVVPPDASDRMWDPALGAGALLDMGIYPLTFARLMLGPYAEAVAVGDARRERHRPRRRRRRPARERCGLGADHLDDLEQPAASRRWRPTRALLTVPATSTTRRTPPGRRPGATRTASSRRPRCYGTGLGNEAAHVQDCLREGLAESPLVPHAQTLELLGVMDDLRRQIGVHYDADAARRPAEATAPEHTPPSGEAGLTDGRYCRGVSLNGSAELVIVANRLPVDRTTLDDGTTEWRVSPGGLVTALEPIMRANEGLWIGWPGGTDVDLEPFEHDGMTLDPIALSAEEIEGFYEGFSNATIWPLYHDLVAKPEFHREWWDSYVDVNRRFAERAAERAAEDATVWVQDYQLQLVPQLLRELRPDLRIGFFLHIPFPPAELFQQLPWRRQLLEGLLGADLVGFQLPGGAANFVRLVRQRVGHKTHRDLVYLPDGRTVRAEAFPISIDYRGFEELARSDGVQERAASIRKALGDPETVFLGIDRLDYTKGIYARLRAFAELIRDGELDVDTRCSSRWPPPRGRRWRSTASCATRSTGWSVGSTATSGRSAAPRSATCTRPTRARRWPRCTAPPT